MKTFLMGVAGLLGSGLAAWCFVGWLYWMQAEPKPPTEHKPDWMQIVYIEGKTQNWALWIDANQKGNDVVWAKTCHPPFNVNP